MKIIDLLNKIANGEEIPKVHYCDNELYIGDDGFLKDRYGDNVEWWIDKEWLNKELEILEEEKKMPEKLGYFDLTKDKNEKDENGNDLELHYTGVADTFDDVYEKINEIIDYLKSKGDE